MQFDLHFQKKTWIFPVQVPFLHVSMHSKANETKINLMMHTES